MSHRVLSLVFKSESGNVSREYTMRKLLSFLLLFICKSFFYSSWVMHMDIIVKTLPAIAGMFHLAFSRGIIKL
jgi:hypothetical protein